MTGMSGSVGTRGLVAAVLTVAWATSSTAQDRDWPDLPLSPSLCAGVAQAAFVDAGRAFGPAQRDLASWQRTLASTPPPADGAFDNFRFNMELTVRGKAAELDAVAGQAADAERLMVTYREAEPDAIVATDAASWPYARLRREMDRCGEAAPPVAQTWSLHAVDGSSLAIDTAGIHRIGPAAYMTAARAFKTPQTHQPAGIAITTVSYQLAVVTYRFDCAGQTVGIVLASLRDLDGMEVGRFNGAPMPMTPLANDPIGMAAGVFAAACAGASMPAGGRAASTEAEMLQGLRSLAGL